MLTMTIYCTNGQWKESTKETGDLEVIEAVDFILSSFGYERTSFHSWRKESSVVILSSIEEN